ncbi:MAG TPA: nuclear transport factor 2 family protein [Acidimicrobiales bacterium]|jgi:ketosteroid isomerase-like protein|nr:nuclear transport factor 2 family protein [Acidimicrobiales bacterium]
MTDATKRNRATALAFLDGFATRDPQQFLPMLSDDPTWRVFHSERRGREAIAALAETAGKLYPHGTSRRIQSTLAEGSRVVVQSVLTAITNAGHDYENYYVMVFEFAPDGRIDVVWEYLNLVYARERFDFTGIQ